MYSVVGVLDELYSAKPAQRRRHTGPPGYIGWTRFQPDGWKAIPLSGLADYKVRLKLPSQVGTRLRRRAPPPYSLSFSNN
jgi:hypothetical protein